LHQLRIVCVPVLHDLCPVRMVVFNHNVMNMYFTVNKSTMYASSYDKVHELL